MSVSLQCLNCLLYQDLESDKKGFPVCDAFPAGIPPEILDGVHDHLFHFVGDNGIVRVPIRYGSGGSVHIVTPEAERKAVDEPLNLSAVRDDSIKAVFDYLVDYQARRKAIPIAPKDSSDFGDWNYYTIAGGRRIIVTRELTRRINYVVTGLKNPVMVFRDVQAQKTTGQKYTVEFFIARFLDQGGLYFANVRVVSDVAHAVFIARTEAELPGILKEISGVEIFRDF
jgi:hypothetical protein